MPLKHIRSLVSKRVTIQTRCASSQPPPPRPYKATPSRTVKAAAEQQNITAPTPPTHDTNIEQRSGIIRYFWPFSKGVQKETVTRPAPDPARGQEAAEKVVETGQLDPQYKDAAFRVTAIIAAMPVVLYLGYVLFQRRFEGLEKQSVPRVKRQDELR